MNTEKIEKLKKTLSSTKLPADLKPKIEAEIKRLEDLDAKESEAKEEVKPVAKKTTTRKPRATKTVAKKTSTRKPSQTSKPKRTPMSLAKEIRKEGESWSDARARASKMMKEKTHTATKDVESELDKLTKLVRGKKELKGQIGRTNLLIDAKRKAKPMGRRISKDGNVYYENRANRTDKGTFGKYHLAEGGAVDKWIGYDKDHLMNMKNGMIVLRGTDLKDIKPKDIKGFDMLDNKGYAEGGYLTDPTFGNFQNQVFADGGFMNNVYADGGGVEDVSKSLSVSKLYDQDGNLMGYTIKDKYNVKGKYTLSNTKEKAEEILQYLIDNPSRLAYYRKNEYADGGFMDGVYAKGGGVRTINGREYSYGRNWTNDHNLTNKGEEHEVNYTRKKRFATGGGVGEKYYVGKFQTVRDWESVVKPNGVRIEKDVDGYPVFKNNKVIFVYKTKKQALDKAEILNKRYNNYELGGVMATDLAGHTGGGTGGLNAGMPLDGFSNTSYTGLVGETGAMSSGEMFMSGGSIDKNFDLSGYKKFRTFNDLEEAKQYVDMDRKKYPRVKESVVIKEGNRFQVWVVPATGIETGNRVYELGGGLPSGVSQSYMITESLGNPAQHFAKGGGVGKMYYHILEYGDYGNIGYQGYYDTLEEAQKQVKKLSDYFPNQTFEIFADKSRKEPPITTMAKGGGIRRVGGREYPLGRNWTNDHEHTNKAEEHEVNYTRKGKFLGVFADGGEIYAIAENMSDENYNKKYNSLSEKQKNKVNILIRLGDTPKLALATVLYGNFENDSDSDTYKLYTMAKGGGVRRVGNREYSLGRNWTNDHEHVNKAEEHETKYTRKKSFAGGGAIGETPKIYVADLEAYNNGRLSGVWLDLADYNDADELMEAIQDFLKTTGGEEYAIHDAEYIPSSMYSEYMGQKDFEELYEMIDLAKENDLPLSVVQEVVSQYDASAVEEFQGRYDSAEDFAQQLVDDIGIESFTDFQYYLEVSDTDRRLLAQDMADSYVDDIRDEDGGNRLIEEAGLDVDEYEEADSDRQEEMLDEAREIVYDEYYNNWYEGLSDPYYFLVEEQGMYDAESFANANFVRVDYEKLGDALEQDYTFIYDDGELYVFNIR